MSYRGTVTAVSGTIIAPNEAVVPFDPREPTYRLSVVLNRLEVDAFGKSVRLHSGDVVGRRRQSEPPGHRVPATVAKFVQPPEGLHPAKRLLEAWASLRRS